VAGHFRLRCGVLGECGQLRANQTENRGASPAFMGEDVMGQGKGPDAAKKAAAA